MHLFFEHGITVGDFKKFLEKIDDNALIGVDDGHVALRAKNLGYYEYGEYGMGENEGDYNLPVVVLSHWN